MDLRIRSQGPHGLGSIQVGNGSQEVGQVLKEIGHSTTLVVNKQESHIMRVEVDGKGKDIFLKIAEEINKRKYRIFKVLEGKCFCSIIP